LRVTFITQYFPPETGAAPARAAHFVRAMRRAGHEVRVITGFPNHPSGTFKTARSGRAHDDWEGTPVERVWLYATPKKTAWRRLWNHISFALGAFPAAVSGPRPDLVLASAPPLFLGLSAWLASRLNGAPLVLDMRDDWPHAAVSLGELREGLVTGILGALAGFIQRRAERIIAVTPGMRRQFESRGLEARRIELITNGADTELFTPAPSNNGARETFTVLYAGTHGLVHGMDVILDAAERLRGEPGIRFRLVGDGVAKAPLERAAAERGLGSVTFEPSLAPEQLVAAIHASDICLATTRDHPFCGETIPVKLFDYLACGRPVVAAVRGDAADIVEASGGGVVVRPEDGGMLAATLLDLRNDPVRRAALARSGPPWVAAAYSRRALGERLAAAIERAHRDALGRGIALAPGGAYGVAKRAFDVLAAGAGLFALSPVLLLVAIVVRLDSPGPALFRQRRSGQGAREFRIVKFRTMRIGTPDLATHVIGDAAARHITRLGAFLRRSSLDELPQFWNVLKGDMSLVGPRPALFNQDDLIALRQARGIDALRPGVTGWAQIHGRDAISMEEKVAADDEYLHRMSMRLDLEILLRTAGVLISGKGSR
jgi:lipopolysaccharide/colanic/teichoic acid biosynthesis glycosyltransferase/glycosyltransferase involved in cell wall biosynthesis